MIFCIVAGGISWKLRKELPPKKEILASVGKNAPLQKKVNMAPFKLTRGGVEWTIKPLYSYDIHAMIVSYNDADSFWNMYHKAWKDNLNMRDLGLIWGRSAATGTYEHISFSSGSWTLYYRWSDYSLIPEFSSSEVSNNHVLLANDEIADKVMSTSWGDQIRIKGYLCEYSNKLGRRGTSTSRDDNGCETIFVTDFEILKRANPFWNSLYSLCIGLLIFSIAGWIFVFFKEPYKCSEC